MHFVTGVRDLPRVVRWPIRAIAETPHEFGLHVLCNIERSRDLEEICRLEQRSGFALRQVNGFLGEVGQTARGQHSLPGWAAHFLRAQALAANPHDEAIHLVDDLREDRPGSPAGTNAELAMRQAHKGNAAALDVTHGDILEARQGRLGPVFVEQVQHAGERRASFGTLAEGNDVHRCSKTEHAQPGTCPERVEEGER